MNRFDLRPRTVGEVLSEATAVYAANVRTLLALSGAVAIPLAIALAVVLLLTEHDGAAVSGQLAALQVRTIREANGSTEAQIVWGKTAGALLAQAITSTVAGVLATAACVRALADLASGAAPSIGQSLRAAVIRLPALIVLYILRLAGVLVGLIAFILPGVWLAGRWSVAVPAVVLEGASPARALGRSQQLVRFRWWPVFAVVVITDLVTAIVAAILRDIFGVIDGHAAHPAVGIAVLAAVLAIAVANLLVLPFNAAVRTVLYFDLRVRSGGEDLTLLGEQLGVGEHEAAGDQSGRDGSSSLG